jgi:proline iminopeptidase
MEKIIMIFGLDERIYADLTTVFARYPAITKVLIFGSRAKGTARPGSDIDLAVVAPEMNAATFNQLWNDLDELPLVFKLDVLHLDALNQAALKTRIEAEGQTFYQPAPISTQ